MKKWFSQYRFPTPLLWTKIVLSILLIFSVLIPSALAIALHSVLIEDVSANISDTSVGRTFQRDTFYGAGRAWVFYMGFDVLNDSHIYFRSSTDGVSWIGRTEFCDVANADEFSLFWDGTYIHTVWIANDGIQSGVSYRRGTPNSNGTITWVATQEVKIPAIAEFYVLPTVTAMAGRPYICYGYTNGGVPIYAAESSNVTTGLWSPDLAFENLDLMAGNMTAFACIDAMPALDQIHITLCPVIPPAVIDEIGSLKYTALGGWAAYETIDNVGLAGNHLFSTIAWGDYMNVVYVQSFPGWLMMHRQSSPGGFWAVAPPPTQISDGSYQIASLTLWDNTNGDLKCFFADGAANNIAWKFFDNALGAWDVGYTELVAVTACDRLETSTNHESPLGVVYEDYVLPDVDSVYYDYYGSFPLSPAVAAIIANVNFWIYLIALVLAGIGILWLFSTQEIGTVVAIGIMLTIGIIICMAFLQ